MKVLVPWPHLVEQLRSVPHVEPVLWNINESEAPAAELVITERPVNPVHRSRINRVPGLKHVHLLSLGYEWAVEHLPRHVSLSNSRGAVEDATAEHALLLILASLRRFPEVHAQQAAHHWQRTWSGSLDGANVVLLGAGGVGTQIAERIKPFRPARLDIVARTKRDGVYGIDEVATLLPHADVVIIALPHTSQTQHLVDAEFLGRMKDGALLVNVGRGALVHTEALLAELRSGRLRAALDVTDPEPLPAEHDLWSAPNCIITPHMAGDTQQFMTRVSALAVAQATAMAASEPLAHVMLKP